ncbi:rhomboid family intramembrane serine protease [Paenibacillus protaetiae]|uniref:Rhomboid family intramembrane serine protease n=1 Tax=Paenibacillus protaetiae TaxID=2509456 RepID=A0A4P6EU11_9BACL|nr:rhomboid family intramembrane serine protease [Paenibacillus protaetiae]QAY66404.1 rhomboid family intramembrane serine protease [Paenibacillus protaetiae]
MIFMRYESFRGYLKQYPVISAVIALNIIYFIIVAATGSLTDGYHLFNYGAFYSEPGQDPMGTAQIYRYVTSMFMHGGIEHLLFNMFALLIFAPPLERLIGHTPFLLFYLLSGILANAVSAAMAIALDEDGVLSVGASGAIYGVYGAYLFLALFRKAWLDSGSRTTVYMILISGIVYSLMVANVNLWAHVGGGLAGFILFGLFDRFMQRKVRKTTRY